MKRIFTAFILILVSGFIFAQTRIYTPELVAPENGEVDQNPNVILDWNAVAGTSTVYYQLRLGMDPNFTDPMMATTTVTAYQTSELYFGETYYWQVRAWDDSDTSSWSEKRSFVVLNSLHLASPNNNKEGSPPNQEVKWDLILGATHFDIQVDTSFYFNAVNSGITENLHGVFTLDNNNVYAVGEDGMILHYDGSIWSQIDAGISMDIADVFFLNQDLGWVVGADGTIYKYDGTNWIDESPDDDLDMFTAIYMLGEDMGYVTGLDGFLYAYDGTAWTKEDIEFGEEMQDIEFFDENFGIVLGTGGVVYNYMSGEWMDMTLAEDDDLFAISILSATDAWIAGEKSMIYHYDGSEYMFVEVDENDDIFTLEMLNSTSGFAFGEEGYMLMYDGSSWMETTSGVDIVINDLSIMDGMGFAVGETGLVLDYAATAFNSPYAHIIHVQSNDSTDAVELENLPFGANVFWRARARHSLDTTAWSLPRNFYTTNTVVLISPIGGDETELIVKLRWKEITGLTGYRIQVSKDETFPDPETYFVDSTSIFQNGLCFGCDYYWRVRAMHETDMSDWTEAANFVTIGSVYLNSPNNNATDISVLPILDWDSIAGVTSYQMQFANNAGFSEIMYDEILAAAKHEYQVLFKLEEETDYYWRVRAMTTKSLTPDTSDWSEVYKFTTESGEIGINEDMLNASLEVYPNPASGELYLKVENSQIQDVELSIMDLVGKSHITRKLDFTNGSSIKKFDVSSLAKGIYIMSLKSGETIITKKLIIDN